MSESAPLLRLAEAEDAGRIVDLIRLAFASQSPQTDPPPSALNETAASVASHLAKGGGGAVAERDGGVVGAVLWEEKDGALYIGRLSVDPACRRQGIARSLVGDGRCSSAGRTTPSPASAISVRRSPR
jgi:tRNA threonylcarbamoyladenosine biosynthesis protein TsaE